METSEIKFQEINASEALDIIGGSPTTETSFAYDIGWVIGVAIFVLTNPMLPLTLVTR